MARNFFLSNEKTLVRKIKEVFLAWRIEQNLTKDEILTLYLNKIPSVTGHSGSAPPPRSTSARRSRI